MAANPSVAYIGLLLVLWGVFSTWCELYNKQILNAFPYPVTMTLTQFGLSSLCGFVVLRVLRLHKYEGTNGVPLTDLLPVTACQAIGFLLTNMSIGKGAVSFVQTVKASAPLFSLLLSKLFLGSTFSTATLFSLIPIIGGVVVTAATEMSFDAFGFVAALGSNVCFTSRSILTKRVGNIDKVNMYFVLCSLAFLFILPYWAVTDLPVISSNWDTIFSNLSINTLLYMMVMNGVLHFAYNQVSFLVLDEVAPLTHAVCNVLRRVGCIVFAIFYFGNWPSVRNACGIASVFIGVGFYLYCQSASSKVQPSSSSSASSTTEKKSKKKKSKKA